MTELPPSRRQRGPVTVLFAAALHGDIRSEDELRTLAIHDDHAAEALCALAFGEAPDATQPLRPVDVAATDQMIASVLDAVRSVAHHT